MEQNLSPEYIRSVIRRRALHFLIPALLGAGLSTAVIMSLPAIYSSQATILVETQQIPPNLVPSTITALATERLQVIEQRITARDSIIDLARRYNLFINNPDYTISEVVEKIRSRISITQADLRVAGQTGRERVAVVFLVAYSDENPDTAARVANDLVTSILQEDVKARTALASETSRFLERESQRLAQDLSGVEAELSKFRTENADVLPDRLAFNVSLLEKAERDMQEIDRELLSIDDNRRFLAFEQSIRSTLPNGTAVPGSIADFEQRINMLKSEIATLSGSYADSHPEMRARRKALQALVAQKTEQEKELADAASLKPDPAMEKLGVEERITAEKIKSLDNRATFLKKQKETLAKATDDIRAMIRRTPEISATLGELERRHAGLRKGLDEMSEKLAQARLSERLEQDQRAERFEVIEQPVRPQEPSFPNRPRLLALASFLAVAAGGGLAYGLEFLDNTVRTVSGFEAKAGLRPLTTIPYITTHGEMRRRRWKILGGIAFGLATLAATLAAVHFYITPIDVIYLRLLQIIRSTT